MEVVQVDMGECIEKIKDTYSIEENLIYAVISKKINGINYPKMVSFSLFDPDEGEQLEINDLCENDFITVNEDR